MDLSKSPSLEAPIGTGGTSPWPPAPRTVSLHGRDVHVWCARSDLRGSSLRTLEQLLAADERDRVARFHFQKDRDRFVAARGSTRVILGRYLDADPGRLQFGYTEYGKPFLATESGANALRFNVSHSEELVLCAITRGREIGVDVERLRPNVAEERIAERFFSPREVATLRALAPHLQEEAFFTCWTRKEAYVKARGGGLTLALDQFDVTLVPGTPAELLGTDGDPEEACRWSLQHLEPAPGYVAALAVEGRDWRLRCWRWPAEP